MKCEFCLERLEEYFDGELAVTDREQVAAHLIACGDCAEEFASLGEEQELFAGYDRNVEVPPFLWTRIAARMPVGVDFIARPFDEPTLFRLASA